jgi:hypothetical protein
MGREKDNAIAGGFLGGILAVTTIVCPPVGVAATLTTQAAGAGLAIAGEICDNDDLRDGGQIYSLAGSIGGVAGGAQGLKSGNSNSKVVCHKHCPPNCK